MKQPVIYAVALLMLVLTVALFGGAPESKPVAQVKVDDIAWMAGRWRGDLKDAVAEEICSRPQHGEILCLFRLSDGKKFVMFELNTVQETPDGLELRSLHTDPNLVPDSKVGPLVLKLSKYSSQEVVFAGPPGGKVKSSTVIRKGADAMDGIIDLVGENNPQIRVHWTRQPY